jgi:hypothetical protein
MSVTAIFHQLSPVGVYCLPGEDPDANLKGGDKREQETQNAANSKKCWVPTTFGKPTTEGVRKSSLNGERLLHCPVRFEESDEADGPTESRIDGLS